jgi:hypothetical protein
MFLLHFIHLLYTTPTTHITFTTTLHTSAKRPRKEAGTLPADTGTPPPATTATVTAADLHAHFATFSELQVRFREQERLHIVEMAAAAGGGCAPLRPAAAEPEKHR